MSHRAQVLLDVPELAAALARPAAPVLLDVRWQLGEPRGAGAQRFAAGHLPGARFLDLEAVLTRHTGDPRDGRHPLPEPATVAAALDALGVSDPDREIVVYDEAGSYAAARAWWVLTWLGLPVRVLDGGIEAWRRAGRPLVTAAQEETAQELRAQELTAQELTAQDATAGTARSPALAPAGLAIVDADGAAAAPQAGVLVDVRAAERYRGDVEPIDPVAGHIPGALNVPVSMLFAADGALPDEDALRAALAPALAAADADRPVVVYCGSGVSAAQAVLALRTLGVSAALYPGSWSSWCNTPGRPVATGPRP